MPQTLPCSSLYARDLSPQKVREEIEALDNILDLKEILDERFDKLSSGMKQKLNLTRALLVRPKILLLDEPTINLDIIHQQQFMRYVKELNEQFDLTILWVSHHIEEIENICERIFILEKGKSSREPSLSPG